MSIVSGRTRGRTKVWLLDELIFTNISLNEVSHIICGVRCKMKMWGPLSKDVKWPQQSIKPNAQITHSWCQPWSANAIPCVQFIVFVTVQACKAWKEITFSPTELSAQHGEGSYIEPTDIWWLEKYMKLSSQVNRCATVWMLPWAV